MSKFSKSHIAGVSYENLIQKYSNCKSFDETIYNEIIHVLLTESFHAELIMNDPNNIPNLLRKAFPLFDMALKSQNSTFENTINHTIMILGYSSATSMKHDDERRRIFDCALLFLFYMGIRIGVYTIPVQTKLSFLNSEKEFIEKYSIYSDFTTRDVDELEIRKLFMFTNLMKTVILLVPQPRSKRKHFIDMIARIVENNSPKYVSGSGASAPTRRRQKIYEVESGVSPHIRTDKIIEMIRGDHAFHSYVKDIVPSAEKKVNSLSFPHPRNPNIVVKADELVSDSGKSVARLTSLVRRQHSLESSEEPIETVLSTVYTNTYTLDDNFDDILDPETLTILTELMDNPPENMTVSRQTTRENSELVRTTSFSTQFIAPDDPDLSTLLDNFTEMIRGNSFVLSGNDLTRSISRNVSLSNINPESTNTNGLGFQFSREISWDKNISNDLWKRKAEESNENAERKVMKPDWSLLLPGNGKIGSIN